MKFMKDLLSIVSAKYPAVNLALLHCLGVKVSTFSHQGEHFSCWGRVLLATPRALYYYTTLSGTKYFFLLLILFILLLCDALSDSNFFIEISAKRKGSKSLFTFCSTFYLDLWRIAERFWHCNYLYRNFLFNNYLQY